MSNHPHARSCRCIWEHVTVELLRVLTTGKTTPRDTPPGNGYVTVCLQQIKLTLTSSIDERRPSTTAPWSSSQLPRTCRDWDCIGLNFLCLCT